ncbi:MAG: alkaline phosphatase family protein [Erysipelotrichaceae bacterium]|nr:alkaline phosphatase family protein [Erysipelotrichaceae bacterium]
MSKLMVFMIDALCSSDLEYMRSLPNFSSVIDRGSYVRHLLPVHPALTYCCHTSILTSCYVDRHGIHNNENYERGCKRGDVWFGMKKEVKVPTLLDYAREAGMTTASIAWPVSAGADYTYNWPMIVPYHYDGDHPEDYLANGNATQNLLDAYFWKYGRYQKGPDSSLDLMTMSVAPDLIRDFGQPDVMLVKMCDLDTVRHVYGVYDPHTKIQLKKHDEEFGVILESVRRYGDFDDTNFVIMGDHGQTNITDILNINRLFERDGLLKTDENHNLVDCKCYAHTGALSCFIELKDPDDKEAEAEVRAYLEKLKEDPKIRLAYVLDKKEMKERYHLAGPYDFVIESANPISFSDKLNATEIWASVEPGDHVLGKATHGSCPEREENTLFIAAGPDVRQGIVYERRSMVDEAVTMAKMIGLEMKDTDGEIMEEMLYGSKN